MSTHKKIVPTHPGIVVWEEYIKPFGITAKAISEATKIPQSRLSDVFAGRRGISADTAVRLGKFLELDPQFFINFQGNYDRFIAEDALERRVPPLRIKPSPKLKQTALAA
jgi:addiction module HigA family antidote